MRQSNMKKLVAMLVALAFIMGIAVVGYAGEEHFEFNDSKGPRDWMKDGKKEYEEAMKAGGKAISFRAAMQSLGPVVSGLAAAIAGNDRKKIVELGRAFFDHPPISPETRQPWFPGKENNIESIVYGLEAHYWGFRLSNHAKDPKVETNVLVWDFTEMVGRCMKCHDRFRDANKTRTAPVVTEGEVVVKTVDGVEVTLVDGVDQFVTIPNDKMSAKDWGTTGALASKAKAMAGMKPLTWPAVMRSLLPHVSGIAEALVKNDREAIVKLTARFKGHPFFDPKTRAQWVPQEDGIEFNSYGGEVHRMGTRLNLHARDPKVENYTLMADFTRILTGCVKCHNRFRDGK